MKSLLCLDLEGTLLSNAVSQIPRPGLYSFLAHAAELCDLVIYTSVSEERIAAIQKLLVAEYLAPTWFEDLNVIRPTQTLKPKSACGCENAFLLGDQEGVIVPGEEDWWIQIPEYLPPYSSEDKALADTLVRLKKLL